MHAASNRGERPPLPHLAADSRQLQARLYAQPDVLSPNKPLALKVVRRKPRQGTSLHPQLEPLPALSAYQRFKNNEVHKTATEEHEPSAKRTRNDSVKLYQTVLPDLQDEQRHSILSLHDEVDRPEGVGFAYPRPPMSPPKGPSAKRTRSTHHLRSAVLANTDPNTVITKYSPPLETLTNTLDIIERLRKEPELGFLYLTPAKGNKSTLYNPYNLRVVVHSKVNHSDYCTLSLRGMTRLREGKEAEFVELEHWIKDYKHFHQLLEIKAFSKFRMWKAFSTWRSTVRSRRMTSCRKSLEEQLFLLDHQLSPALMEVKKQAEIIETKQLMAAIDPEKPYTLEEFRDCHTGKLLLVSMALSEFLTAVKSIVRVACDDSLTETGFVPDPATDDPSTPLNHQDSKEMSTYTMQAAKRKHCQKLTRFVRLCDYIVTSMLHQLTTHSVQHLLDSLHKLLAKDVELETIIEPLPEGGEDQDIDVSLLPPIKTPSHHSHSRSNLSRRSTSNLLPGRTSTIPQQDDDGVPKTGCLFTTSLLLETEDMQYSPSENEFKGTIMNIIEQFQECALAVPNLIPDALFHSFTRPLINHKLEDKVCGSGPSLDIIFRDDTHLLKLGQDVTDCIGRGFDVARDWASKFELYQMFYNENEALDLVQLEKDDHDVPFFRRSLYRYRHQHAQALACPVEKDLGLLMVDTKYLKEQLIPCPLRCLEAIHEIMPQRAKELMDKVIKLSQDAVFKLESDPAATIDYVNLLTFLSEIQDKVEGVEGDAEIVKELYELIDMYQVPIPPEHLAIYQTLKPAVTSLRTSVDKAVSSREQYVDKFCRHLDQDITELGKEAKEIKNEAQNPMVLDPEADEEKVREFVSDLLERLEGLLSKAATYKTHQKNFKVEVTRYEELEETHAEVKLKQLLWDAQKDWEEANGEWMETPFEELQPDAVNQQVLKFAKCVYQLEKGLPPNNLVPILKSKVESMRSKMPVIQDLRNPSLKPRHWMKIEEILDHKFEADETKSLKLLSDLKAFDFAEAIQEVSGQASSEASLEGILKKVEDAWKAAEFTVLPHRESKDVFILGGTDDIQVLLDDSIVNVNTIAGSRHVGPIKTRVDDWEKQLALFAETLDEWLICQRNWLYLESIFGAPDIQRQLPNEAKMFSIVDKSWKEVMRRVHKVPLAIRAGTQPGLLEEFKKNNALLDQIQKCLEDYLEAKRLLFPRFYFLSNDELLEILSQTRNPQAVQPHLRKCFDAIAKLEFAKGPPAEPGGPPVFTSEILAMLSPEQEKVPLQKGLKARGNVESWLTNVEESMVISLRKLTKAGIADFETRPRHEWATKHPSQVVLSVSQIMWCRDLSLALSSDSTKIQEAIKESENRCFENLNKLAELVRGELAKLVRSIIGALITIDVHARDIVTHMVTKKEYILNLFDVDPGVYTCIATCVFFCSYTCTFVLCNQFVVTVPQNRM